MRTLTTKKGMTVQTDLTDEEALKALTVLLEDGKVKSDFAADLNSKSLADLSPDQIVWVHKFVIKGREEKPADVVVGDFAQIMKLFDFAKISGLKYPKVSFKWQGMLVQLSLAGEHSKAPETIAVTGNGHYSTREWFGRISKDGTFEQGKDANEAVIDLLRQFAQDPEGFTTKYGHVSNECCFCGRELTDKVSSILGRGPVCSKKYGLSYGS